MYNILIFIGLSIVGTITSLMVIKVVGKKAGAIKPLVGKGYFKNRTASILAVLVFIAVLVKMRNIIPAALAALIIVYLPYQVIYLRHRKLKERTLEQLALAVNLFSSTYTVTKSIPRSIEVVGNRVPDPLGRIFRQAYSELIFGIPIEKVSGKLAQRIGLSYGYVFAKLLKSAQNHGDIILPLFRDLSGKIVAAQEKANFQIAELSAVRGTNIVLLFLPIPAYLILSLKFDEMSMFASSVGGRIVFTVWLISWVIWLALDRMVVDN